jgi:hypothetical protein
MLRALRHVTSGRGDGRAALAVPNIGKRLTSALTNQIGCWKRMMRSRWHGAFI